MYAFEARIFDSRLGRFFSKDPLEAKYASWSPYIFAGCNPIRYVDVLGMGPGDRFGSIDEAAIVFAKNYNDNSIVERREYGTAIIKVVKKDQVYYTYVTPRRGLIGTVLPPNPIFRKVVAYAHTHSEGTSDGDYNEFSQEDYYYVAGMGKPFYLVTPNGSLLKIDPNKKYPFDKNYEEIKTDESITKKKQPYASIRCDCVFLMYYYNKQLS